MVRFEAWLWVISVTLRTSLCNKILLIKASSGSFLISFKYSASKMLTDSPVLYTHTEILRAYTRIALVLALLKCKQLRFQVVYPWNLTNPP